MQLLHVIGHFLWTNGVGQNVTAGVLMAIPTGLWARRKWRRKLKPAWQAHHQRVQELHSALVLKTPPPSRPRSADE